MKELKEEKKAESIASSTSTSTTPDNVEFTPPVPFPELARQDIRQIANFESEMKCLTKARTAAEKRKGAVSLFQ